MLWKLRVELKAIQEWPAGEMVTATERVAVTIRALRSDELMRQIREIAARN
jgi:hypothetical protein